MVVVTLMYLIAKISQFFFLSIARGTDLHHLQGVPKEMRQLFFPVTTGTNTLSTWKTKTDMESPLSKLFSADIFCFYSTPFQFVSICTTTNITPTLLCSVSQAVTEQCKYPALYHALLDISNIKM